ncbi:NAD(P)H-quinone oxidoreductase [Candidatus Symbiobacter mobilis]|uniref:NADPH:quinone oxidoreductase-like protein n=1 Tax=Candidatus Symbiobacter mobilis CR TaxID=946483 RepID=U5NC21_9BURK|nr:NAD(P)H-quinone oxidoreductase [Candidatus Symbiobacter mobilis]AGX87793.1 NADPH:quinone oxidoreductase-like protein [Candidatus Symbiobacter mobilis CR]
MQVIEIAAPGGPEVLRWAERPMPVPRSGELRIAVHASGVNRPDVLQRQGRYPPPPGASDIPGLEVAGIVVDGDSAGLRAAGLREGDAVCALVTAGGYAQYCVAPIGQCLPCPRGIDFVGAASLPEAFCTVWSNLIDRAGLRAGERVLVHGGASGIGVAAIQIAKAFGAWVAVTARNEERCAACRALGADLAICHATHDFCAEVLRATGGDRGIERGVDIVLDMVAGDYTARNLECLRDDGRLVLIGVQGGAHSTLDCFRVMRRRLTITGSTLRPRSVGYKSAIVQALREQVWSLLEAGVIRPVVHATFAAQDAALAHAMLERGEHVGKIVLLWEDMSEGV